jgi:hypothetical protein
MAREPSQAGRRMVVPLPRPDGPRRAAAQPTARLSTGRLSPAFRFLGPAAH